MYETYPGEHVSLSTVSPTSLILERQSNRWISDFDPNPMLQNPSPAEGLEIRIQVQNLMDFWIFSSPKIQS